jgi:hypothetical protein
MLTSCLGGLVRLVGDSHSPRWRCATPKPDGWGGIELVGAPLMIDLLTGRPNDQLIDPQRRLPVESWNQPRFQSSTIWVMATTPITPRAV